jgi:hypothetical protein
VNCRLLLHNDGQSGYYGENGAFARVGQETVFLVGWIEFVVFNIVVFEIIKVVFRDADGRAAEVWLRMKIDKESRHDVSGYDVMCVIAVRASYLPLPR